MNGSNTSKSTDTEPTHYVVFNGAVHFVKEAEFFKNQGGLTEPWGNRWKPVVAKDIEDAREQSKKLEW